jgi:hypothetical protein
VLGSSNFLTLQTFGARRNHLLRTNHPCIRPVSFAGVSLIDLCLPALNAGTKFVAQGAAPFAGPEAFSFCHCVRPIGDRNQLSVLIQHKTFEGHPVMNRNRRSENAVERSETVAQVAPAWILGRRDLRLLSCEANFVACPSPLECALTQKRGRGVPPRMSLARKGYPQDALFAGNRGADFPRLKRSAGLQPGIRTGEL